MSWQELAAKRYDRSGVPDTPYFSLAQLLTAQQIVAAAQVRAEQADDADEPETPAVPPRTRTASLR
jgi:hypothetical protein